MKRKATLCAVLICALWGTLILAPRAGADEGAGAPTDPAQVGQICDSDLPELGLGGEGSLPITGFDALLQWLQQGWDRTTGNVPAAQNANGGHNLPPRTDGGEEGFDILYRQ